MTVPFSRLYPPHCIRVVGSLQRATGHPAQIIRDHIVEADPVAIMMDPVQQLDQLNWLYDQSGFLFHFPHHAGVQRFPYFEPIPPAMTTAP